MKLIYKDIHGFSSSQIMLNWIYNNHKNDKYIFKNDDVKINTYELIKKLQDSDNLILTQTYSMSTLQPINTQADIIIFKHITQSKLFKKKYIQKPDKKLGFVSIIHRNRVIMKQDIWSLPHKLPNILFPLVAICSRDELNVVVSLPDIETDITVKEIFMKNEMRRDIAVQPLIDFDYLWNFRKGEIYPFKHLMYAHGTIFP